MDPTERLPEPNPDESDDQGFDPHATDPLASPGADEHLPTVIIDGEDFDQAGNPGYSVRPRQVDMPMADPERAKTEEEEEFVVLLPEDSTEADDPATLFMDAGGTPPPAFASSPSGDAFEDASAWEAAETMKLDSDVMATPGGGEGMAPASSPLTEFLDADDPFVASSGTGFDETQTMAPDEFGGPESGTEDVRLLASHPSFMVENERFEADETATLDGMDDLEDLDDLPDLENVEDITALLDSVEADELSAPQDALEMEIAFEPVRSESSSWTQFVPLAAAAAALVAAVLYGPMMWENFMGSDQGAIAKVDRNPAGGGQTDPDGEDPQGPDGATNPDGGTQQDPGTTPDGNPDGTDPANGGTTEGPDGTDPPVDSQAVELAEFRTWVSEGLAQNLGRPETPEPGQ